MTTTQKSLCLACCIVLSFAGAAVIVPVAAAATAPAPEKVVHPYDRDGDGSVGEATAIRRRIQAYRELHGVDGELDAQQMLDRARFTYQRHLERRREWLDKGIEGNGWISLGPSNGAGRIPVLVPHPSDQNTLLAGAAGGGLWRSVDAGESWVPLTDGIWDLSVGAAAYAPGNPDVIYLGTGEGGYAADFIPGIGLLRSDDGGDTWQLPNSAEDILATQFFALNVFHGPDSDVGDPGTYTVLAATNAGLFRSADGGSSWETVIPGNGLVGVSEILRPDPAANPDLLYAAAWCSASCPEGIGRVMRSTDGGTSWLPAVEGLPGTGSSSLNRNALTSTADGRTLYVGMNTSATVAGSPASEIWRSDDMGDTWTKTGDAGTYLGQQGWYDNTITVHPTDPDVVIAGGVWYVTSNNGGLTWTTRNPYNSPGGGMGTGNLPHVDAHDLKWIGDTLWVGCDGGVWRSFSYGATWEGRNNGLVTRQYYGMAIDPIRRERVLGGTQDNATNLKVGDDSADWNVVVGGDGFECAINSLIPDIMYGTIYDTAIYRNTDGGEGSWRQVTPLIDGDQTPFITPLTMRHEKPWELYTGTDRIWKTTDGGETWFNLSTEVENISWGTGTVSAIAVTPADEQTIMVAKGSLLYSSHNGGQSWHTNIPGAKVLNVAISPFDANLALACMSASATGLAGIRRTVDGGLTWIPTGNGLPPFAVQAAAWDPTDPAVAYAGTDVGLYRSTDGGTTWSLYGDGLPAASIHDLRILPDGSMLKVATHGRGMWELVIDTVENQSPTVEITSPTSMITAYAGDNVAVTASATDPDGDPLHLTWIVADEWTLVDGGTGTGTMESSTSLPLSGAGRYQIGVNVTDGKGGAAFDTVTALVFEPAADCATPRVIPGAGPFPVSLATSNSTSARAESDPPPPCIDDPNHPFAGREASVWFEFTPVESNVYTVSTCASNSDTVLSAWTGDACGPYTAVAGGCSDDDEQVHCAGQKSDSYLELQLDAGTTYRFMVGAYNTQSRGKFRLHVDCATCGSVDEPPFTYVVPAASNAAGDNGTSWLTDLNLYNPNDEAAEVAVAFLPAGSDNRGVDDTSVRIAPGAAVEYPDAVGALLGAIGSGALRIGSSHELVIASRTYNTAENGSFGQFIPGLSRTAAVAPGGSTRLVGLAEDDAFRSNLGLANASPSDASVTIELYGADGALVATRDESLPPYGWLQINRILDKEDLAGTESVSALVHNNSEEAYIAAYASIVDATTGDPVYVSSSDEATPDGAVWVAASAHADGVGSSVWRTDLELANTSDLPLVATVDLLAANQANPSPQQMTVELQPAESRRLGDVVLEGFGASGAAALRITVDDGSVAVTSRTYNQTANGTFGQYIPGMSSRSAVHSGERAVLTQLRQDAETFRTNVGVVNLGDQPTTVEALYFAANGAYLGYARYDLEAHEYSQDNGAVPGDGCTGGFVILSTPTADASFLAYASVIDSGSDDPVFIPAVVLAD